VSPRSEREYISDEGRCQEKIVLLRIRRVKHPHLKVNYPSPRDIFWSKDINELIDRFGIKTPKYLNNAKLCPFLTKSRTPITLSWSF